MGERIDIAVRVIPHSKADRLDGVRAGRLVLRVAAGVGAAVFGLSVPFWVGIVLGVALVAAPVAAEVAPSPAPHQVDIPLAGGVLHAQLFKPDGDGPFPVAVVGTVTRVGSRAPATL